MNSWQEYVLNCFPKERFYNFPVEKIDSSIGMKRLATHDLLVQEVTESNIVMAPACLSLLFRPKVIVEMGVHHGWTTLLLCKLNPEARVHAVDVRTVVEKSGNPTGYIPLMHKVNNLSLHIMNSWDLKMRGEVDLCLIDADHTLPAVEKDTWTAWENRNKDGDWCIAWDDYRPTDPDVQSTVDKFCMEVGYPLQKIGTWVWIGTKTNLGEIQWSKSST